MADSPNQSIFIKHNPIPGSRSIDVEVRGLQLLASYQHIHGFYIPKIVEHDSKKLCLEKLHPTPAGPDDFERMGILLARLHNIHANKFGLEYDNYIGLNPQFNGWFDNWGKFFYECRLLAQVNLITDSRLKKDLTQKLERAQDNLVNYLNAHQPQASLLHGDLWLGNVLFCGKQIALIDPAVYYGDAETDLAMTQFFSGFHPNMLKAYQTVRPLKEGYLLRSKIYNLYHALNHYNLFGLSYMDRVKDGLLALSKLT